MLNQEQSETFPPGWPESVPLPTLAEAEAAVRKVGEMIEAERAEQRALAQAGLTIAEILLRDNPFEDDNPTVNI